MNALYNNWETKWSNALANSIMYLTAWQPGFFLICSLFRIMLLFLWKALSSCCVWTSTGLWALGSALHGSFWRLPYPRKTELNSGPGATSQQCKNTRRMAPLFLHSLRRRALCTQQFADAALRASPSYLGRYFSKLFRQSFLFLSRWERPTFAFVLKRLARCC